MSVELTREQTLERLRKTVAEVKPLMWLYTTAFILALAVAAIAFLFNDLRGAIAGLLGVVGCGFVLLKHHNYMLILKISEPLIPPEAPASSARVPRPRAT